MHKIILLFILFSFKSFSQSTNYDRVLKIDIKRINPIIKKDIIETGYLPFTHMSVNEEDLLIHKFNTGERRKSYKLRFKINSEGKFYFIKSNAEEKYRAEVPYEWKGIINEENPSLNENFIACMNEYLNKYKYQFYENGVLVTDFSSYVENVYESLFVFNKKY